VGMNWSCVSVGANLVGAVTAEASRAAVDEETNLGILDQNFVAC
jgi:hypothetical protein